MRAPDKPWPTLRIATWPVLLVAGIAVAGSALLSGAAADDLDPTVWRAIIAQVDAVPALVETLTGEI